MGALETERSAEGSENIAGGFFTFKDVLSKPTTGKLTKLDKLAQLSSTMSNEKSATVFMEAPPPFEDECEASANKLEEKDIQMVALLVASGISLEVVSKRTSFEEDYLLKVCSSARFEAVLQELQKTLRVDASSGLLQAQKIASIRMLSLVRDDPTTQHKDRITAAKTLLQMSFDNKSEPAYEDTSLDSIERERLEIQRLLQDPSIKQLLPK